MSKVLTLGVVARGVDCLPNPSLGDAANALRVRANCPQASSEITGEHAFGASGRCRDVAERNATA
jgi:hypothetical protein